MSQNDDNKKQAEHAVRAFFSDPRVAEAVVNIAVRKKPAGWSKRSNAPYFNSGAAKLMKEVADEMMRTREDQVYFYKDFPTMSRNTLYLRINQSLRYLLEYMDTEDNLYAKWAEMVAVTRERGTGVRLSFKEEYRFGGENSFKPKAVLAKATEPKWKTDVDEYLESGRTSPLHIDKLMLTPEEIGSLKESLVGVQNILFRVTASEIKIVKTV